MSSKRSPAARVLEFFTIAPIGEADLVLGLVREVVKKRKVTSGGSVAGTVPVVKRRTRKAVKVNAKAPLAGDGVHAGGAPDVPLA